MAYAICGSIEDLLKLLEDLKDSENEKKDKITILEFIEKEEYMDDWGDDVIKTDKLIKKIEELFKK